jgi:3-hydroxyisobutyrate dehydrogenase-like beta-hydroxyacid dehydrogenase
MWRVPPIVPHSHKEVLIGGNRAFENKVPHMLDADYTPTSSSLDTLLKDFVGFFTTLCLSLRFFLVPRCQTQLK